MKKIAIAILFLMSIVGNCFGQACDVSVDGKSYCDFWVVNYGNISPPPSVSNFGEARVYFDLNDTELKCSFDGGAYQSCGGGGGTWGSITGTLSAQTDLQTAINNASAFSGWTDGGTNVYVTTSTDNVGIGTTEPGGKFVVSSTQATNLLTIEDNGPGDTTPFIVDSAGNVGISTLGTNGPLTFANGEYITNSTNGSIIMTPVGNPVNNNSLNIDLGSSWQYGVTFSVTGNGTLTRWTTPFLHGDDASTFWGGQSDLYMRFDTGANDGLFLNLKNESYTGRQGSGYFAIGDANSSPDNNINTYAFWPTLALTGNSTWANRMQMWHDTYNGYIEPVTGGVNIVNGGSLGTEKVTNGTFTGAATSWTLGTGWAYSANTVTKNADGTGTLSQTSAAMATALVPGETYALTFTVSSLTVGSFVPSVGGQTLQTIYFRSTTGSGTFTQYFVATSTADLVFTPTNTSRFTLDTISVKKITGGNLYVQGNVGIGTASPGYKLDVNGDLGDKTNAKIVAPVSNGGTQTVTVPSYSNLYIANDGTNPNYQVDITADYLALRDTNDLVFIAKTVIETVDLTASGANGLDTGAEGGNAWYYIWIISKADGTVDSLFSLSATAPTMPSGYTFKMRVGAVRNNGSSNLFGFTQVADQVDYDENITVLSGGTATTMTDIDVSAFIPPTSRMFNGTCYLGGGGQFLFVRRNGAAGGGRYSYGWPAFSLAEFRASTDTAQIFEYKLSTGTATDVRVAGYADNL